MEHVRGYAKRVRGKLVHVTGYDRKSHDRITPHDREVDRRNVHKAEKARRGM